MPGADGRGAEEGLGTGFLPSDSRSSGGLLLPSEENPSAPAWTQTVREHTHIKICPSAPASPWTDKGKLCIRPSEVGFGWTHRRKQMVCPPEVGSGWTDGCRGRRGRAAGWVQKQKRLRGGAFSYPEPERNNRWQRMAIVYSLVANYEFTLNRLAILIVYSR